MARYRQGLLAGHLAASSLPTTQTLVANCICPASRKPMLKAFHVQLEEAAAGSYPARPAFADPGTMAPNAQVQQSPQMIQ
eukprot:CAMPEP_0172913416 /NCGR_PEP_ID=MMETSP1075-20121228/190306_1 /TAXON_ID=2916 /ORGANISM="Ceratium fusus, Strain PA161109" /LENGTH=79 /DNA_ID=CAMNT_0013772121 /DNA_START=201 /DNA_END=440 /DNA_ORIENTATION=+